MNFYRRLTRKSLWNFIIVSGTPAFSCSSQICTEPGGCTHSIYVFILSEWHTAWNLLFNPVTNEYEKQKIREKLKVEINLLLLMTISRLILMQFGSLIDFLQMMKLIILKLLSQLIILPSAHLINMPPNLVQRHL